jgi:hypothetical protein
MQLTIAIMIFLFILVIRFKTKKVKRKQPIPNRSKLPIYVDYYIILTGTSIIEDRICTNYFDNYKEEWTK